MEVGTPNPPPPCGRGHGGAGYVCCLLPPCARHVGHLGRSQELVGVVKIHLQRFMFCFFIQSHHQSIFCVQQNKTIVIANRYVNRYKIDNVNPPLVD